MKSARFPLQLLKQRLAKKRGHFESLSCGSLPLEEIEILNRVVQQVYWKEAVERLNLPILRKKREWFINPKRGYPYRLIPVERQNRVLDVGAGGGVIADVVSEDFKLCVALDYSKHFVKFMKKRFEHDKKANIAVIRGNAFKLPFRSDAFDLVILSGILEWVPFFGPYASPRKCQLSFLREVWRVLVKKGKVAIAIENRYFYRNFWGYSPHGEVSYICVMPRVVAHIISLIKRGMIYKNYIYSFWGYKKLLRKIGFRNIQIFLLCPNYYTPLAVVSTEGKAKCDYFERSLISLSSKKFFKRIIILALNKLRILHLVEHSFLIVAQK